MLTHWGRRWCRFPLGGGRYRFRLGHDLSLRQGAHISATRSRLGALLDCRTLLRLEPSHHRLHLDRLAFFHEDTRTGGIAGEITARINENAFEWLDAPILRVTAADVPLPYSPPLEDYVLPQTSDIVVGLRKLAAY